METPVDERRLRVGVAQVDTRLGKLEDNLEKHLAMIEDAKRRGLKLLVFPETSLSGFPAHGVHDVGLRRSAPELARIAAASEGICVVVGFVEEAPGAQFYNTCIALRDGQQLSLHRKLNLATYGALEEGKYFAQGRFVESFDLVPDTWRPCPLICADAWNPALVHLAALHGATLLVVPINSAKDAVSSEFSNPDGWDLVGRFYAMIYGLPFLMANRIGTEAGLTFWGGSRIIDPFGSVLAEADGQSEMLIEAELDYREVRKARIQLPTVRDSNLGLVHREIGRLQAMIGVPSLIRES